MNYYREMMNHISRGLLRFASRAVLVIVLILVTKYLHADGAESYQLWGNVIFCYPKGEKLYFELDFEPKIQYSGPQKWWNIDATPLLEYYPNKWIDLTGEVTTGYTKQTNDIRSFELTPRIGIRLHILQNLRSSLSKKRIYRREISFANLLRIENRRLNYFGDLESTHEWRLRDRLEFKLPINHENLSIKRTLYIMADLEAFIPLTNRVSEKYASKARMRAGLGYRGNYNWRIELLYIRDWTQDTIEEEASVAVNAIDLRFKVFF